MLRKSDFVKTTVRLNNQKSGPSLDKDNRCVCVCVSGVLFRLALVLEKILN